MCLNKDIAKSEKGFMDFDVFKKIIDEASYFVCDVNLFHRGESLLHPEIFEMIKYAKDKGLSTRLNTNATLLDKERSYQIFESGLDFLSFSFDGYEKKIYENIRRGADFNETLDNILRFLTIKRQLHKNSPYTTFTVIEFPNGSTGEMRKDIKKQFIKKFDSLPLNQFVSRAPHNWAGGYNNNNKILNKSFLPCTFPWYSLTIFWDGRVVPCPQDFFGKLTLGNVKDSSLLDIWNGPKEIFLREKLSRREYKDIMPCNRCDRLWRRKLFGVPMVELGRFLKDNLVGYNRSIRKILR
jgi:radical SAM protein with 4Fe4S-binding SPASM domain